MTITRNGFLHKILLKLVELTEDATIASIMASDIEALVEDGELLQPALLVASLQVALEELEGVFDHVQVLEINGLIDELDHRIWLSSQH